ncbi:MAG TPA: hypothetical protein VGN43_19215 [Steroidobacteraceae bacterium]|jgi:hypothetical protein|nr:hypothetical protein [Steroidobacteraceae bacterium]
MSGRDRVLDSEVGDEVLNSAAQLIEEGRRDIAHTEVDCSMPFGL